MDSDKKHWFADFFVDRGTVTFPAHQKSRPLFGYNNDTLIALMKINMQRYKIKSIDDDALDFFVQCFIFLVHYHHRFPSTKPLFRADLTTSWFTQDFDPKKDRAIKRAMQGERK